MIIYHCLIEEIARLYSYFFRSYPASTDTQCKAHLVQEIVGQANPVGMAVYHLNFITAIIPLHFYKWFVIMKKICPK